MLAGGLITAPIANSFNYYSGADDIIKIALVGCGGRGTGAVVQALSTSQNVKLVAMADVFRDKIDFSYNALNSDDFSDWSVSGANVKDRLNVPEERKYTGFDAYKYAIRDADVVILATSPGFRPLHFEECVRNNKHVFMEKPVATDVAGVHKVLEAAKLANQKKLNVVVGLQNRYQNMYRELYKRKDMIGEILSSQSWYFADGRTIVPRKEGWTEMQYQLRNWYQFLWLSGDFIVEQHIHNLDTINWFKNAYPVKAQGMGGREVRKGKDSGEIYDHHFVEFQYADGSIYNSQCRQIPGTMNVYGDIMIGTKGKINTLNNHFTDLKGRVLYQFDQKNDNVPYQTEHDELFEAVAKNQYKFADAEHGANSTMTGILGRMATYSGQTIEWDKAMALSMNFQPDTYAFDATPRSAPDANGNYKIPVPGVTTFS